MTASVCLCGDEDLEGVCAYLCTHVIVSLSVYHLCESVWCVMTHLKFCALCLSMCVREPALGDIKVAEPEKELAQCSPLGVFLLPSLPAFPVTHPCVPEGEKERLQTRETFSPPVDAGTGL